jgi:RNase P/RNase MRP subunit p30
MTYQSIYRAIVCVLRATQTASQHLEPDRRALIRERIEVLEVASACALKIRDSKKLRSLCDEVSHLGEEVKSLL